MSNNNLFQIRATGILIEDQKLLIVKQKVSEKRSWSLPGGRVEHGETLEEAIVREVKEETGIDTSVIKLLYICEVPYIAQPILHITFLLDRISGDIMLPTNEFDLNPIHDVKLVPFEELEEYQFSRTFFNLLQDGFPQAGSYMGEKKNIGL